MRRIAEILPIKFCVVGNARFYGKSEGFLGKKIQDKFENDDLQMLTVLKAMGEETVIATEPLSK